MRMEFNETPRNLKTSCSRNISLTVSSSFPQILIFQYTLKSLISLCELFKYSYTSALWNISYKPSNLSKIMTRVRKLLGKVLCCAPPAELVMSLLKNGFTAAFLQLPSTGPSIENLPQLDMEF